MLPNIQFYGEFSNAKLWNQPMTTRPEIENYYSNGGGGGGWGWVGADKYKPMFMTYTLLDAHRNSVSYHINYMEATLDFKVRNLFVQQDLQTK